MEWSWTLDDVAAQPGYKAENIAAYRCDDCGTVVPIDFVAEQESPPDEVPDYPCPQVWNGCGKDTSLSLVSDGFVDA